MLGHGALFSLLLAMALTDSRGEVWLPNDEGSGGTFAVEAVADGPTPTSTIGAVGFFVSVIFFLFRE